MVDGCEHVVPPRAASAAIVEVWAVDHAKDHGDPTKWFATSYLIRVLGALAQLARFPSGRSRGGSAQTRPRPSPRRVDSMTNPLNVITR